MRYIPYSRQTIDAADIREVEKTLKSPFLTQGPKVAEFEKAIARYTGARYCVAFSSGTAALHAAYFAAGIGEGHEVIVPALTFAATGNAALYLGAKPVFADIIPDTGNIDVSDVKKKITKKTKAIVAVDYAGLPAELDGLRKLAKQHKLVFIEDAAQALGATYKGKKVGVQADMTMFSFHPVKTITTGEGGVITTSSKEYYEKLLTFRSHGLTKDPKKLKEKGHAAWHQEMQLLGYNYRLPDVLAALGVSQMRKIDRFLAQRRSLAKNYFEALKNMEGLTVPPRNIKESAWHLFAIRITSPNKKARDTVFTKLRAANIGAQVHYLPVYLHPHYRTLGYKKGLCPKAEEFAFSEISLPLYPTMTSAEQAYVIAQLRVALGR